VVWAFGPPASPWDPSSLLRELRDDGKCDDTCRMWISPLPCIAALPPLHMLLVSVRSIRRHLKHLVRDSPCNPPPLTDHPYVLRLSELLSYAPIWTCAHHSFSPQSLFPAVALAHPSLLPPAAEPIFSNTKLTHQTLRLPRVPRLQMTNIGRLAEPGARALDTAVTYALF
jgi:hypothetical protein